MCCFCWRTCIPHCLAWLPWTPYLPHSNWLGWGASKIKSFTCKIGHFSQNLLHSHLSTKWISRKETLSCCWNRSHTTESFITTSPFLGWCIWNSMLFDKSFTYNCFEQQISLWTPIPKDSWLLIFWKFLVVLVGHFYGLTIVTKFNFVLRNAFF